MHILLKVFQNIEEKGIHQNSFSKAIVTLNVAERHYKKIKKEIISLMNIDAKTHSKRSISA